MKSTSCKNRTRRQQYAVGDSLPRVDCICRFLYITGVQSVRILRRVKRKVFSYLRPIGFLVRHLYSISFEKWFHKLWLEFTAWRISIADILKKVKAEKQKGVYSAWKEFFHSLRGNLVLHKKFVCSVLDVAVPAVCVLVLFSAARHWAGMDFALILSNQGKQIAEIKDEKVYEEATEMVNQRMVHDTVQEEPEIQFAPGFQLTVKDSGYQAADSVCNLLIKQSNGIIEDASGLYVDGKLQSAVKSSADLRYMLEDLLNKAKGTDKDATAHFVKNVEIVNGLYPTVSIISTEAMHGLINGTAKSGTTYTVKDGDTATSIAEVNNTTVAELKKINHNLGDSIHPGDLIQLQIATPALEVELVKAVTYEAEIPYSTVTQKDDSKYSDYSRVVTEGINGKQRCVDIVHTVNGVETKRESVSKTGLTKPVDKVVLTGTMKRPVNEKGVASGRFMWPVPSLHDITTYFTWRWGVFHKGIDISGSGAYGCTIVAADGGVITLSGWNDGYGKCIIIDHGNGKRTLYGHCSSLLVSEGEAVAKGQPIGRVGSTGDSTGSHCHFEVISGGANVDPMNYVSP